MTLKPDKVDKYNEKLISSKLSFSCKKTVTFTFPHALNTVKRLVCLLCRSFDS